MSEPILSVLQLKSKTENDTKTFKIVLLVKKVSNRVAKNGSEFLVVELGDSSGSFQCTCFSNSYTYDFFKNAGESAIVEVEAQVSFFKEAFSPKILQVRLISEEEIREKNLLSRLIQSSQEDVNVLWEELQGVIAKIKDEALRATVNQVMEDYGEIFRVCTAAISMHHAYRHGLIEHSVHIARVATSILPFYPEVDADLALAGIILHDIGKIVEYEGEYVYKKTRKGILQGHVVLGYRIVRKAALQAKLNSDLLERLEHIILSHQGQLEYGAAVLPATPEALFVSLVDNLDAKLAMIQQAVRVNPTETDFCDIYGLHEKSTKMLLAKPIHEKSL